MIAESTTAADLGETLVLRSLLLAALALSFFASSGPIQWMDNGWFMLKASQGLYFNDRLDATYHPLYQLVIVLLYKLSVCMPSRT